MRLRVYRAGEYAVLVSGELSRSALNELASLPEDKVSGSIFCSSPTTNRGL